MLMSASVTRALLSCLTPAYREEVRELFTFGLHGDLGCGKRIKPNKSLCMSRSAGYGFYAGREGG